MFALIALFMLKFRKPELDAPFWSRDVQMERGFWGWIIDHDFIVGGSLVSAPVVIVAIGVMVLMG
jgi:hypothetical protein